MASKAVARGGPAKAFVALLVVFAAGCAGTTQGRRRSLCLGGEQCAWDKTTQRGVCRCEGWAVQAFGFPGLALSWP